MDEAYAQRHSDFVSGHNGTSPSEIIVFTLLAPASLLIRNLLVPFLFPARSFRGVWDGTLKLCVDFILVVAPMVMCYTVLADSAGIVLLLLTLLAAGLLFFSAVEYYYLCRAGKQFQWTYYGELIFSAIMCRYFASVAFNQNNIKIFNSNAQDDITIADVLDVPVENVRPIFITYLRSYALLSTCVLILAVDFPVFPRRLAKTETYGYGLMDAGVGAFAIINGMAMSQSHRRPAAAASQQDGSSRRKSLRRTLLLHCGPLVAMGLCRLLLTSIVGYHTHVTEYGVHWNFFFTLAALRLAVGLLSLFVPLTRAPVSAALSISVISVYEFILRSYRLDDRILNGFWGDGDSRSDFLDANREGIFSIAGYLSLYLAGAAAGGLIAARPRVALREWLRLLLAGLCTSLLLYGCWMVADSNLGPASRRLANLTYCVWIVFCVLLMGTGFLALELLVMIGHLFDMPWFKSDVDQPFERLQPCLMIQVNRRPLTFFLVSNLSTGLINLIMPTIELTYDAQVPKSMTSLGFAWLWHFAQAATPWGAAASFSLLVIFGHMIGCCLILALVRRVSGKE